MIPFVLILLGAGLLGLYAVWWTGRLLDAGRWVRRNGSPGAVAAFPFFGAGWLFFGLAASWGPGAVLGFLAMVAGVGVLFGGASGEIPRLVPPALAARAERPTASHRPSRRHAA